MKILLSSFLLLVGMLVPSLTIRMDLQETTATMRATWTYDPPAGAVSFIWSVTNELTGIEVLRDTTGLQDTGEWTHPRTDTDVAYLFEVNVYSVVNGVYYPSVRPYTERYVIPARAPYILVVSSEETTAPDSIPHDPSQELAEGTLWLEFTPNTLGGRQGLWSKDYNGFENGGHMTVILDEMAVRYRIQSDSATYEFTLGTAVAGQKNQIAVTFGPTGFSGWLNGVQLFIDPYTGGTIGNENAIVVGANSQGADPWTDPLNGTMHTTELYDGLYDFSGRWDEAPIPPPPPICDTCVNVIRVAWLRVWRDNNLENPHIQYRLAPAGYNQIDYRVGLTEYWMYELWSDGQKVGYSTHADGGVLDCSLGPGGECEFGEVIPVRPFRPGEGYLSVLGSRRSHGLAGVLPGVRI